MDKPRIFLGSYEGLLADLDERAEEAERLGIVGESGRRKGSIT